MSEGIRIRTYEAHDEDDIWGIIQEVISTGDTYVFSPDSKREEMMNYWCGADKRTYVAEIDGNIAGTFVIKSNQPGLGNHIANASYMTRKEARGRGIGTAMAEFSMAEARKLGYRGMQFNVVIKSNQRAIDLWKKLGFEVIGEIPDALRHASLGYTNAYIMFKSLI